MRLFTIKEWFVDDKTGTTIMGDWRRFEAKTVRRVVENAPQYFALVQCISMNLRSIFWGFFSIFIIVLLRSFGLYFWQGGGRHPDRHHAEDRVEAESHSIHGGVINGDSKQCPDLHLQARAFCGKYIEWLCHEVLDVTG